MKPIRIARVTHERVYQLPTILHLECGGDVVFEGVGTASREPLTGTLFVVTPKKGAPSYYKQATRALESLHLLSGIKLHTC